MRPRLHPLLRNRRVKTAALLAFFLLVPALAVAAEPPSPRSNADRLIDVRKGERVQVSAAVKRAQRRLRARLGRGGVLRTGSASGTPRLVADLDAALTPPRPGPARAIATSFLDDQRQAYSLNRDEVRALRSQREFRSREGVTYVQLRQTYRGLPSFDGGATATVKGGRLLSLAGSLQPDVTVPSTAPKLTADEALRTALRDARVPRRVERERTLPGIRRLTRYRGGHRAGLVVFAGPGGARLGWALLVFADRQNVYRSVVDANSGRVLRRANLVKRAGNGRALDYYPGVSSSAPSASTPELKPFGSYIDSGNDRLRGDFSWTYSDDADDRYLGLTPGGEPTPLPANSDEVRPSSGQGTAGATWDYTQATEARGATPGRSCPPALCTWNGFPTLLGPTFTAGDNWQKNRAQAATQAHYFVSRFHDHLLNADGIDFDEQSGNFEEDNASGLGEESDPVHTTVDVGANTAAGFPDDEHTNNASMITLPDGFSPLMQMYLFTGRDASGINDVNGADDAQVVLHEYGHGLSGRLVCCDADGFGQLDGDQAGAMGEAWSDWYMFDYLVANGYQGDSAAAGELVQGEYENAAFVTQPTDCPVSGSTCSRPGYTYANFGRIVDVTGDGAPDPEVHADGEIWTQTLWDLRRRLIAAHPSDGVERARRLITGAMRRSAPNPDFLDMRDAILLTDSQLQSGSDQALIRSVFAVRGMGVCASSDGSTDTTPTADFRSAVPAGGCSGASTPTQTTVPSAPSTAAARLADIGFGGFPSRRTSLRRVLRRGLAGRVSCDANCTFRAALVLPRASTRKARFRGRNAVVARLTSGDAAGGSGRRIRFRFKRRVASKMRRLTRGTVIEVRVTATDSSGTRRTEKKKLRLRR